MSRMNEVDVSGYRHTDAELNQSHDILLPALAKSMIAVARKPG